MLRSPLPRAAGLVCAMALVAPSAAAAQSPAPKPAMKVATFASKLEKALTTPNCPGLKTLQKWGQIRLPCPSTSNKKIKAAFKGFRVTGTRTYGTGAVIDFVDAEAPKGGTYILLLSGDREWSIVYAPLTNTRTSRFGTVTGLSGHQNAVNNFLTSVRDGNCDLYFRFTATPRGEKKAQSCAAAFTPPNGFYVGLQADLKANPNTVATPIGGNRRFAFFSVVTGQTYRTAVSMRTGRGANVPFLTVTTERV